MNNNFFSQISLGGVRTLLVLLLSLCSAQFLYAYDFLKDGIYYNITSDNTVSVTSGNSRYLGVVTIPETVENDGVTYSVTSIGDRAFYQCIGLTELTIGNSVASIGDYAFYQCFGLAELTIPNSVTSIGEYAFRNCTGLTELTIPNSVTSIGDEAFSYCSGLTTIVSLIEEPFGIGYFVFYPSDSNATLYVPKNTKSKYTAAEGWQEFSKIIEDIKDEKAAAEDAYQEWQKVYGEYVPGYAEDGDVTTLYQQAEAGQEANSSKVQELLSSIEALETKISESAMSEEDKQSYLATLQEMKDQISALENEGKEKFQSNQSHEEATGYVDAYQKKLTDYLKRIEGATTCKELTELAQEMASDAEAFKTSCDSDSKYLEEVIDRLSEILDALKKYEDQLKEYDTKVDDMIAKIFSEHRAEADAAYKNALDIYEQYMSYYEGEGMKMKSYEQILDAQTKNEGKASGILNEIDELIKKVTESAMTDDEKAPYLKTLEELKTSVSALEAENKDILSDNTFLTGVQGHYAEVVSYHDGFASYEQRIEEATTSAKLLEIIAEMEKATENVKTTCLKPVVDEYEKLAEIANRIAAIRKELETKTTELQACSDDVDATIAEVFEKHRAEADAAYKEAQSIYEQYLYYYNGEGMESYKLIVDAQTENEGKASVILNEIDELIKKVKESAMTDDEKAPYLKTLDDLKTDVSALEAENKDILSDNTFFTDVQEHYDEVVAYHDGFASYEQRIEEATTSAKLLEIIAEMEKATKNVKTTYLDPVVSEYGKLEAISNRIAAISEELEAKTTELQACLEKVDATIAEVFEKHQAEAAAAYKEAQNIYEQYLYYYSGEGMESYKQIEDAQTENEDKASVILNEIDELIEKVKESAMTDDEKASYLKTLEDLKTDVSALEAENKDILSDNTFLTGVQGHYAEVVAYHDGFAGYEQRIEEATTSAKLLEIIAEMEKATKNVKTTCLAPVVSEYGKLEAISNRIAAISEELEAKTTELQDCSKKVDATIAEVLEKHRAEADAAYKEAQSIYEQYLYYYNGEGMESYEQIVSSQQENTDKASGILSEIGELIKKVTESAMTDDEKASYLKMLEELKTSVSDLEAENKDILSKNTFLAEVQGHYAEVAAYHDGFADYEQRIKEAATSAKLLEIIAEIESATEKVETTCLKPVVDEYGKLEAISNRIAAISEELKAMTTELQACSDDVDATIAKVLEKHRAEADAAYKEAQSIYEQYLYYYNGEGMESYKQIVDAQTENEGKASVILNEIDELIKKVKEAAMTDEEKASYLKMLEELKTDVSALEAENKDILSDNTFLADVQGHYAEVAAYHDGFASYEQRIEDATTSAELLAIIEQMKAATEEVEKSCLNPVVSEYEKLAAISDELDKISEQLDAYAMQLESVSGEVNDILTGIVNSVYGADDEIMVYTLSGMGQKMKKSDLRSLPKGIYIINGRKYVVK